VGRAEMKDKRGEASKDGQVGRGGADELLQWWGRCARLESGTSEVRCLGGARWMGVGRISFYERGPGG
jgi:hypothetical protein